MKASFLFLVITLAYLADTQKIRDDTPRWPSSGCSFTSYEGQKPLAGPYIYSSTRVPSESTCREACAGDGRCGMYSWYSTSQDCYRYQHSTHMWDSAGLPSRDMLKRSSGWYSGSKACREQTSGRECNDYRVYRDRKFPSSGVVTNIYSRRAGSRPTLTARHCQTLCSLFSACASVQHRVTSGGTSRCYLYRTTISDSEVYGGGVMTCHPSSPTCGTYDRGC